MFDSLRQEVRKLTMQIYTEGTQTHITQLFRINSLLPEIIQGKVSLDRVDGELSLLHHGRSFRLTLGSVQLSSMT